MGTFWAQLFCMAWPIFVLVWWVKPDSRPRFVQQVIDFVRQYPKQSAMAGIAFGLIGGVGNLADGKLDSGLLVWRSPRRWLACWRG